MNYTDAESFLRDTRKQAQQNIDLQFFDATLIATWEHLYFAALNALQAFHNNRNISKSLAMEAMLYTSAQRQIKKAIQRCGIKPQTTDMAVLIIGENSAQLQEALKSITHRVCAQPDETVLKMTKVKLEKIEEAFQITDKQEEAIMKKDNREEAIVRLVIERVALLATQL